MRGGSYLGVNEGKWRGKSHLSFGVHRVIWTYVQTQVKCIERGDRDDTFQKFIFLEKAIVGMLPNCLIKLLGKESLKGIACIATLFNGWTKGSIIIYLLE